MEIYKTENLSFTYPDEKIVTLKNINISVNQGEFITLCGKSGCGKTTFLRLLKASLAPFGHLEGKVYFKGDELCKLNIKDEAAQIGFVMQNPDSQIVTDKVWHELAFGLESLGYSTPEIRTRVSEMASFFGIQDWFYKKVTELSGGQKQLLNLASVMVMQPSVLILDEPTGQLDPIAAREFLNNLGKINQELGTTIILTEHRLEEAFPISDRVIVMDNGEIIADTTPKKVGEYLKKSNHDMYFALPTPMKIYNATENGTDAPLTIREGRTWLENYSRENTLKPQLIPQADKTEVDTETIITLKDVWFRYEKNSPDIIKGLNLRIKKSEFFVIVGGNGTGKSTALSLISGINTPYRGEILLNGKSISKTNNLYNGILGALPQNPQTLFSENTLYLELMDMLSEKKLSDEERNSRITRIARLCQINHLLHKHPYDLSGGEQQRAALAKILLLSPKILLLDEPTKGMDAQFKSVFANILKTLSSEGITVIMVSHDIEFCAEYADRCAMLFDGTITSVGIPRNFFSGNAFYTTSANRMGRAILPSAILADDIILACDGKISHPNTTLPPIISSDDDFKIHNTKKRKPLTPQRIAMGSIFIMLFLITCAVLLLTEIIGKDMLRLIGVIELMSAFICFFPKKETDKEALKPIKTHKKITKRTVIATFFILFLIPLTIYFGIYYLHDRKYYFISLLIILETIIPFLTIFESRGPKARELVIISVLCAIGVAGRTTFFMLPHFKPVVAVVIIAGVCFGGESGFLVGAITGFLSNFFFGQGPWTPWQMFAFGIIGFIAGILFQKGLLKKTTLSLCIFGGLSTFIIYGGIMNIASVLIYQPNPTAEMIIGAYTMGIPFDLIHAISTVFFLWAAAEPMIEKSERIKLKYGLIER